MVCYYSVVTTNQEIIMSNQALLAIRAVGIRKTCGRYAASQFARRHGVSKLYRLALQLSSIN